MNDFNNYGNLYNNDNDSFIYKIAYKLGAKNRKQAEMILIGLVVVVLVAAAIIYFNFATPEMIEP